MSPTATAAPPRSSPAPRAARAWGRPAAACGAGQARGQRAAAGGAWAADRPRRRTQPPSGWRILWQPVQALAWSPGRSQPPRARQAGRPTRRAPARRLLRAERAVRERMGPAGRRGESGRREPHLPPAAPAPHTAPAGPHRRRAAISGQGSGWKGRASGVGASRRAALVPPLGARALRCGASAAGARAAGQPPLQTLVPRCTGVEHQTAADHNPRTPPAAHRHSACPSVQRCALHRRRGGGKAGAGRGRSAGPTPRRPAVFETKSRSVRGLLGAKKGGVGAKAMRLGSVLG